MRVTSRKAGPLWLGGLKEPTEPAGSTVRVVGFPSPDVDGCRDPDDAMRACSLL